MYQITPKDSLPSDISARIFKGAQLAYWGVPQIFEMVSDLVREPFTIAITIAKDGSNPTTRFDVLPIVARQMEVKITNPFVDRPTASLKRAQLLFAKGAAVQLTLSFVVFAAYEAPFCMFCYEFYEEPIAPIAISDPAASSTAATPSDAASTR